MDNKKRLIDADALERRFHYYRTHSASKDFEYAYGIATRETANAPTVDAVEVVHGRWIHTAIEDDNWGGTFHKWTCSNCDFSTGHNPHGTNYCPNCGAKMDGDSNA